MNRMNFVCCATNHSQESENSPQSFWPFIRVNLAAEELTRCGVDNDSGKCKARSALSLLISAGRLIFPSDDVPVALVVKFVHVEISFHAQASQVGGQCV